MNELYDYVIALAKMLCGLPGETYVTYSRIMFDPFSFFSPFVHGWGKGYVAAGLTVEAFPFESSLSTKNLSKSPIMKWLIQIPLSKVKSLTSKGGVLLMSSMWIVLGIVIFPLFYLRSGNHDFTTHRQVLAYSLATVYLTISVCIMIEHLIMKAMRRDSILSVDS